MAKNPELMRDRGLLHSNRLRQLTYRAASFGEGSKDAHAARRSERLHRVSHAPGHLSMERPLVFLIAIALMPHVTQASMNILSCLGLRL